MKPGSHHTADARERIAAAVSAGQRARWQRERERASLALVALDDAERLAAEARVKIARVERLRSRIVLDGSLESQWWAEAVDAAELAVAAYRVAAHFVTRESA